jgi:hypothetical protein
MKPFVVCALFAVCSSLAHAVDAEPVVDSESFDPWAWIVSLFESGDEADTQTTPRYIVKSDGVIYD